MGGEGGNPVATLQRLMRLQWGRAESAPSTSCVIVRSVAAGV